MIVADIENGLEIEKYGSYPYEDQDIWNIFSEAMMSYIENDVDIEKHDSVNTATANEIAHSEMS